MFLKTPHGSTYDVSNNLIKTFGCPITANALYNQIYVQVCLIFEQSLNLISSTLLGLSWLRFNEISARLQKFNLWVNKIYKANLHNAVAGVVFSTFVAAFAHFAFCLHVAGKSFNDVD